MRPSYHSSRKSTPKPSPVDAPSKSSMSSERCLESEHITYFLFLFSNFTYHIVSLLIYKMIVTVGLKSRERMMWLGRVGTSGPTPAAPLEFLTVHYTYIFVHKSQRFDLFLVFCCENIGLERPNGMHEIREWEPRLRNLLQKVIDHYEDVVRHERKDA